MANRVAVVVAVLIVGAIGVGLDRCGSGSGPGTATDAERVCQEIVERVLRSPAAVDFEDDATVTDRAGGDYMVTGSVDHETADGSHLSTKYTCEMRYDHTDRSWKVTGIDT